MRDLSSSRAVADWFAGRLRLEARALSGLWLTRLEAFLALDRQQLVPTHQLDDHLPAFIDEIANALDDPAAVDMADNIAVMRQASELGQLRFVQHATVRQVLGEHQILATVLENFFAEEVAGLLVPIDTLAAISVQGRLLRCVHLLQQQTVDAFVGEHIKTIERQTAQLRRFSRLVSHEIRQPLGVLQVITRALAINEGDVESTRMMDIFGRSVARLAGVTGNLERLARITQATDVSPSEQQVDLSVVAADAAAQLADAAAARGVEVRVQENLPVLRLDVARAELVLINLIANGIKYADPEKPRRFVEVYGVPSDQPTIIVRDNGRGIPASRLQNIFREFVRAHAQRDHEIGARGLGLGLAIVRECMDAANGSVRVESREGVGTTFKLTWPGAGEDRQGEERRTKD